ncbi:SMC family ATPase [Arthrobacter jiangjiafuii]|uniref:Nuclease SbcCD subunit C n=1 Tax=Arthrobacter jiangjiafuii TaxID=2817475 RepID=A0A975R084_9MICC|nr:SMC family ATPase [Arthrobacter jiangjiafuii]MBP3044960.1 SMC family ATPase [Arthrobacter jiangjiafuii]QWC09169.1 SMC family ATPase [Arthrobacter jiangjiafuii]
MRIHRLEIQAFGPFADRQVIDFDELGAHGLFLLNGPTGAGKTSILDAICYALYGGVPGARQTAKRLRSDHAAPETAPEVLLEFSSGERRLEVVRNPAWDRPAKRGTGKTVPEQAHTTLRELINGEWVAKSARNDEAGAEILALMGMNKEQFTRVVMLPQGDFAAFLRADAGTRADLLQKLFGTTRFEDIERQLKDDLAAASEELKDARTESEHVLRRARDEMVRWAEADADADVGEAKGDDDGGAAAADAEAGDTAAVEEFRRTLAARAARTRQEHAALAVALQEAEAAQQDVEQRRARGIARVQLERDEAEHLGQREMVQPLRAALAQHAQADALNGYLRAADSADLRLKAREEAAAQALDALAAHPQGPGYGFLAEAAEEDQAAALAAADARLTTELGAAEAALSEEQRISALEAELADAVGRGETRRAEAAAAAQAAGQLQTEEKELARELEALRERASRGESARAELEQARAVMLAVREYAQAAADAAAADTVAAQRRGAYQDRRQEWQDKLQRRLEQAAAELAGTLQDGCGCPVCGSTEHPAPASLPDGENAVSKQDEEQARLLTEAAEQDFETARLQADDLNRRVAELRIQGGDGDPEQAQAREQAAAAGVESTVEAAGELAAALERAAELAAELDRLAEAESAARLAAAQAEEQCVSARRQIADLRGRVDGARDGFTSLAQRVASLTGLRTLAEAARRALADRDTARENAASARQELAAALEGSIFDSAQAVRDALLDGPTAASYRESVSACDQEEQRLALRREGVDSAAALDGEGEPLPVPDEEDLVLAADEAEAARGRLTRCAVQLGLLEASTTALRAYGRELSEAAERIRPLEQRYDLLRSVADTARGLGENGYKMTLSTYVLAARLEQVAAAATERLSAMTGGRYALVHSDSTSGNKKAGLGLHVTDAWTGQHRDTSTLSGGESFMASLALALGLADVVQQEAGGVSIETLFVDEGFGSLDDSSLEQVMDALEGLRDGGRVVGLVSHVAEMKQRIGAQLQITKGRHGSSVRFSAGDPVGV